MNWFRIIVHKLFRVELCVLEDFDGTLHLRRVRRDHLGRKTAERMGFNIRRVVLAPDGTTPHGGYVHNWYPYPYKPIEIPEDEISELERMYRL